MKQKQTRERIAQVDAVLWEVWDPIGVNYEPQTRDEYTSYAPEILELLDSGASDAVLEQHLTSIVLEQMGMTWSNPERTRRTIAALRALDGR